MHKRTLGAYLSGCRRSRRVNLKTLAPEIGISINTLSSWERDVTRPDTDQLTRWVEELGLLPDERQVVSSLLLGSA